jgi:hypothetical protein
MTKMSTEYWRRYNQEHVEQVREKNRRYYWRHRETEIAESKAYRKTEAGAETAKRGFAKYKSKHLDKLKARWRAQYYVPRQPCIICGEPYGQRHHPDYEKPLEVVHLCTCHHFQVHNGQIKWPIDPKLLYKAG